MTVVVVTMVIVVVDAGETDGECVCSCAQVVCKLRVRRVPGTVHDGTSREDMHVNHRTFKILST